MGLRVRGDSGGLAGRPDGETGANDGETEAGDGETEANVAFIGNAAVALRLSCGFVSNFQMIAARHRRLTVWLAPF
jgi:hypothetical protein